MASKNTKKKDTKKKTASKKASAKKEPVEEVVEPVETIAKEKVATEEKPVDEPKSVEKQEESPAEEKKVTKKKTTSKKAAAKKEPVKEEKSYIEQLLDDRIAKYEATPVVGPRELEQFAESWADILIVVYNSNNSNYYNALIDFMVAHPNMVSNSNGIIVAKRHLSKKVSDGIRAMVSAFTIISVARIRHLRPKLNLEVLRASIKNNSLFHYIANIVG